MAFRPFTAEERERYGTDCDQLASTDTAEIVFVGIAVAVDEMGRALADGLAGIAEVVDDFLSDFDDGHSPLAFAPSAPHDPLSDDGWPVRTPDRVTRRTTNYRRGWARPPPGGVIPPGVVGESRAGVSSCERSGRHAASSPSSSTTRTGVASAASESANPACTAWPASGRRPNAGPRSNATPATRPEGCNP